ncbi:hypothetical protein SteCoe_16702 [Stentor coeruleus]|uniref:Uncharacterized protein n=1 Tax=Stentor coeruleus TaxID=5963 RepID=A0A1R2C0Q0_9CILI|nr:hypothetical protein SteCoe_16702 [Stentor coeruleus]
MKKQRSIGFFDESELKSRTSTATPNLMTTICNRADLQDVIIPFTKIQRPISKNCANLHRKTHSDCISDRVKVEEFLKSRKPSSKAQLLTANRDISHLKDKTITSCASFKVKRDDVFALPQELSIFPSERLELCEKGQEDPYLFPYILQKYAVNTVAMSHESMVNLRKIFGNRKSSVPGRQDVSNLRIWYETMKMKYFDSEIKENAFPECKGVIATTLKELITQISFSCHEQGELILDLFKTYALLINRSVEILSKKYENQLSLLSMNFKQMKENLKGKIVNLKERIQISESLNITLQENEDNLRKRVFDLEQMIENMKKTENGLKRRTSLSMKRESEMFNYEKIATSLVGNALSNLLNIQHTPELESPEIMNAKTLKLGSMQKYIEEFDRNMIDHDNAVNKDENT